VWLLETQRDIRNESCRAEQGQVGKARDHYAC
jgi:hypothetical protein